VKVDCKLPLKFVLTIIPWAWIYYYVYPWVRYPILMPAMLFMAIGWWQETNECVQFIFSKLYPNNYYRTFVLGTEEDGWGNKESSSFTAVSRYFTTFAAGMRGLIDLASDEHVADLLKAKKTPKIYTRLLSLGALLEEIFENAGGLTISVLAIMREEATTAAYTSLVITVISFLIETGRMLGKIYKVYEKKPCTRFGALVVLLYRKFQVLFCSCLFNCPFCPCCNRSTDDKFICCLCPDVYIPSPPPTVVELVVPDEDAKQEQSENKV